MNVVWLMRGIPDLENIAPFAHILLSQGHKVLCVSEDWSYGDALDHHIIKWLLTNHSGKFSFEGTKGAQRRPREVVSDCQLILLDWGPGLKAGLTSAIKRRIFGLKTSSLRDEYIALAVLNNIKTVCLPHGFNTRYVSETRKINKIRKIKRFLFRESYIEDYSDRSVFDLYVFSSKKHMQISLDTYNMRGVNSTFLPPIKFAAWWRAIEHESLASSSLTSVVSKSTPRRLAFCNPKWKNNIDQELIDKIFSEIHCHWDGDIFILEHPRAGVSNATYNQARLANEHNNIRIIAEGFNTVRQHCDVVIDFGTSIAIDALLDGTSVIYPLFADPNGSIVEHLEGALICRSFDDLRLNISKAGADMTCSGVTAYLQVEHGFEATCKMVNGAILRGVLNPSQQ